MSDIKSYTDFETVFDLLDGMVIMPNPTWNVDEFSFKLTIPERSVTVMDIELYDGNAITRKFEFTWVESDGNIIRFYCGHDAKLTAYLCKSTVKKRNEKINEIVNG